MPPEILDTIVTLAVMIVMALISALVPATKRYLASGTAQNAAVELTIAAETVVRAVEQTLRPALADGNLSTEDRAMLKGAAKLALSNWLETSGRKFAAETLDQAVEAAVNKLRREQGK